ncbi:hypothetical protein Ddye_012161 [Dipteronia dyeriana]|uniref:Uncharacterized protein n=1 Tax=Dipteronia dyeriana TaxID=168575 RepID=A0AAD9X3S9_9ROSI|nr:hypothetical protein Ddye_012161 [Dipteronia dyeriana]
MATLQKFKLLATQCAVSSSPTRSPTTSPVIHLRRRKTLRMLLNRRRFPRQDDDALDREAADVSPEIKNKKIRSKLKDLFVSSPPFEETGSESSEVREGLLTVTGRIGGGGGGGGSSSRRGSNGLLRPISATFRYRLLRRAWRPVLVSIPE